MLLICLLPTLVVLAYVLATGTLLASPPEVDSAWRLLYGPLFLINDSLLHNPPWSTYPAYTASWLFFDVQVDRLTFSGWLTSSAILLFMTIVFNVFLLGFLSLLRRLITNVAGAIVDRHRRRKDEGHS